MRAPHHRKRAVLVRHMAYFASEQAEVELRALADAGVKLNNPDLTWRATTHADLVADLRTLGLDQALERYEAHRDPGDAVRALMNAKSPAEAGSILDAHPEVFSEWGLSIIDQLRHERRFRAWHDRLDRIRSIVAEGRPGSIQQQDGADPAAAAEVAGDPARSELIRDFATAGIGEQRLLLAAHPELLGDDFLAYMREVRETAGRQQNRGLAEHAGFVATLLDACRRLGPEQGLLVAWYLTDHDYGADRAADPHATFEALCAAGEADVRSLPEASEPGDVGRRFLRLGDLYMSGPAADRAHSLRKALDAFASALAAFRSAGDVEGQVDALFEMGGAYVRLPQLQGEDAPEKAISCLLEALALMDARLLALNQNIDDVDDTTADRVTDLLIKRPIAFGDLWRAYTARRTGSRAANLDAAVSYAAQAVALLNPVERSRWVAQLNLGHAYLERAQLHGFVDITEAVDAYRAVTTSEARALAPATWAAACTGLANAYGGHVGPDPLDTLQRSISAADQALTVFMPDQSPHEWATTVKAKASAVVVRRWMVGQDALRGAAALLESALGVLAPEHDPSLWSSIAVDLGIARSELIGLDDTEAARTVELLDRAVAVQRELGHPSQWAMALLHSAHARAGLGEADARRALASLEECITALPDGAALVRAHLLAARGSILGRVARDRTERRTAETSLRHALEIYESEGARPSALGASVELGALAGDTADWSACAGHYAHAAELEAMQFDAYASVVWQHGPLGGTTDLHTSWAYALTRLGRLEEAALAAESGRARGLAIAVGADEHRLATLVRSSPELVDEYRAALAAVRASRATEGRLLVSISSDLGSGSPPAPVADDLTSGDVSRAHERLAGAIRAIRAESGFADFGGGVDADSVRAACASVPLVYLVPATWGTVALLVSERNRDLAVDLVAESTDLTSGRVRELLAGESPAGILVAQFGSPAALTGAIRRAGVWLEPLLDPIGKALGEHGADRVQLVACGQSGLLPLHAITGTEEGHPLGDEVTIVYAPSARVASVAARRVARPSGRRTSHYLGTYPSEGGPEAPAFARDEVTVVSALLRATVEIVESPSISDLRAASQQAGIVHFACHASFDPGDPRASRLELGRAARLTAGEVVEQRIGDGADLVVLSACQTAITEFARLPDEVTGIGPAFIEAGAGGVIATQWPVNALAAALFTIRLASFLAEAGPLADGSGRDHPLAVRRSQEWLRESTSAQIRGWLDRLDPPFPECELLRAVHEYLPGNDGTWRPFAEPYWWAGFIYIGGAS